MEPWYKVVTPRKEVREGRSFDPSEFAIALEQVVAGNAPDDYRKPKKFFERTYFTQALKEHSGLVLRRLAGETQNTAPVLTLITQFGGGKTHTLTALYHLATARSKAQTLTGVPDLVESAGLTEVPKAKVAVFVGNAWDPKQGTETPWLDIAHQLAGKEGVAALGESAQTTPPGTEALNRVFAAAGGTVLILFDEVLNFANRHRKLIEPFHAFVQNLTVAMTGTTRGAAVISLPRSQVEMTAWDQTWQERITKVVRRVAKDLIANDETEISEVVRRRLFEDLGGERLRKNVAKAYADWCFERRAQLPPEWTSVDSSATEKKAREHLQARFEACYPFHPATLSVFQRKWQTLPQYQQTRGTLAMFAQWISHAYQEGFTTARREPLLTLGSAPLDVRDFQHVVVGQLGEHRLGAAIDTDISSATSHCRALDADTKGPLRSIHKRVASTILFESSGGQVEKVAHLPELRFALGEPEIDTTSVDSAALKIESKAFFIHKVGSDGFKIHYKAKIDKAVNDRRAGLDYEMDVKPIVRKIVEEEFRRGASVQLAAFPEDSGALQDVPKLTLVIADPEEVWTDNRSFRDQIGSWLTKRGDSPRLYPASNVWCMRKPGNDLRDRVELMLAWKRVQQEVREGTLGADYDRSELNEMQAKVKDAESAAKEEVWASYRYVILTDREKEDGLRIIDLGAGHSSSGETLCGRVIAALKSEALLNEGVGAGYISRHWPEALKKSGEWPLSSLRQSFLDGSLTRLLDPDRVLQDKIINFVSAGDFGLASGKLSDGSFDTLWFETVVGTDEIQFDPDVFLLTKKRAKRLKELMEEGVGEDEGEVGGEDEEEEEGDGEREGEGEDEGEEEDRDEPEVRTIVLSGAIPSEVWNRLGQKLIPKLKSANSVSIRAEFQAEVEAKRLKNFRKDLEQALDDLGLSGEVRVEERG